MQLLTQNEDLKKGGIWGWTLPAHWVKLPDGRKVNTCPNAGVCAAFCYAKTGRWLFSNVQQAHKRKLMAVVDDLPGWFGEMRREIQKVKYDMKAISIHDGGDFFSREYAEAWIELAKMFPDRIFYTYTKEVQLFKYDLRPWIPPNFITIYSFGGKQDHLIDKETDRHSDVFGSYEELVEAGYNDIGDNDLLAAIHPNHKVGLYRNNIPHFAKKQGKVSFSDWQQGKRPEKEQQKPRK